MENRLERPLFDRQIAGVCAGIGQLYGIDSNLVRMVAVFVLLATGVLPLLAAYVAGWYLIPNATSPGQH